MNFLQDGWKGEHKDVHKPGLLCATLVRVHTEECQ